MQTPRPDYFTYPQGYPDGKARHDAIRPWTRVAFIAGLVGAFALGLAVTLAA